MQGLYVKVYTFIVEIKKILDSTFYTAWWMDIIEIVMFSFISLGKIWVTEMHRFQCTISCVLINIYTHAITTPIKI